MTYNVYVATSAETARCLRSDARENRDRILAAAAQAFADEGVDVSLIEIARRAGVGNATLHRNFTREQLIEELFRNWSDRRKAIAEAALADPDPWHGLVSFLEDFLADATRNCAIRALFAISPAWREQARATLGELLSRAQQAGSARADLTAVDLTIALIGVSRTMDITAECSPGQWRRNLAIVLDGMKACHAQRLPGLPASPEELDRGLRRVQPTRPVQQLTRPARQLDSPLNSSARADLSRCVRELLRVIECRACDRRARRMLRTRLT
jgi:AcrR family transcriptional regulator